MRRIALAFATVLLAVPAAAQGRMSPAQKCHLYHNDWNEALRRYGRAGLSADFLARHDAFIAKGCSERTLVCARSPQEIELANALTLRAIMAGRASTFLPFGCE